MSSVPSKLPESAHTDGVRASVLSFLQFCVAFMARAPLYYRYDEDEVEYQWEGAGVVTIESGSGRLPFCLPFLGRRLAAAVSWAECSYCTGEEMSIMERLSIYNVLPFRDSCLSCEY